MSDRFFNLISIFLKKDLFKENLLLLLPEADKIVPPSGTHQCGSPADCCFCTFHSFTTMFCVSYGCFICYDIGAKKFFENVSR